MSDAPRGPVAVRPAGPDDAAEVTRLMIAFRDWWQRDMPDDDSFARSCDRLLRDPGAEFLLAESEDGCACGVVLLRYRFSVWLEGPDCLLEDLFVEERARRLGAGRLLVEAAVERARERGSGRIELDVNDANRPALELYAGLGFSAFSDPPGGNNLMMRRYFDERAG